MLLLAEVQDRSGETPVADRAALACTEVAKLGDETSQPMQDDA